MTGSDRKHSLRVLHEESHHSHRARQCSTLTTPKCAHVLTQVGFPVGPRHEQLSKLASLASLANLSLLLTLLVDYTAKLPAHSASSNAAHSSSCWFGARASAPLRNRNSFQEVRRISEIQIGPRFRGRDEVLF